jgi:CRISPR/Cas system type I-B associated protein Csh2 (Cas7 group RAMP superfamily)
MSDFLNARQEFFFAYDIRMGNPNGDPDLESCLMAPIMLLTCA